MGDFNLALVIVSIVVCVLVFIVNVYLLVNYQHPDDKNQAYFPKFIVVLGLSVAAISILMLPADVANRQACRHAIYNGACNLTLPMKDLWLAINIIDAILVFIVIPFAMFYYEGDQDKTVGKRMKSALMWVITTAIICGLVLGILYGLSQIILASQAVIHVLGTVHASPSSESTWTMRSTFPEYVVALTTVAGSVLFSTDRDSCKFFQWKDHELSTHYKTTILKMKKRLADIKDLATQKINELQELYDIAVTQKAELEAEKMIVVKKLEEMEELVGKLKSKNQFMGRLVLLLVVILLFMLLGR